MFNSSIKTLEHFRISSNGLKYDHRDFVLVSGKSFAFVDLRKNLSTFGQIGSLQNITGHACLAETFKNLAREVAKLSVLKECQKELGCLMGIHREALPGHQEEVQC